MAAAKHDTWAGSPGACHCGVFGAEGRPRFTHFSSRPASDSGHVRASTPRKTTGPVSVRLRASSALGSKEDHRPPVQRAPQRHSRPISFPGSFRGATEYHKSVERDFEGGKSRARRPASWFCRAMSLAFVTVGYSCEHEHAIWWVSGRSIRGVEPGTKFHCRYRFPSAVEHTGREAGGNGADDHVKACTGLSVCDWIF
jgi:hypothetical protein